MNHSDRSARAPAGPWLANRRRTRVWAGLCAAWSTAFACLVLLPGRVPAHAHAPELVLAIALYLAVAALGLAFAGRVARAGVRVDADAVVIRGPFRTRAIALRDAGRFAPGLQGRGGNGVPCPMLERPGRGAVGVWALGRRNVWFRYDRLCAEIQPVCDELNARLAAARRI